jgi:uncharacterized protein YneF (UPF0154 family)
MKWKSVACLLAGLSFLVFVVAGYWFSDSRFASQIVEQRKLTTPEQVFRFVLEQMVQALPGSPVDGGASFRELMARDGWLWCDEGAVVIAVLVGQLGYETRLVDLVGKSDGISHHTVLQILQKNGWVTYDFTGRQFGIAPVASVEYEANVRVRAYPQWHHLLLLNNYFIRLLAQQFRPVFYGRT